MTSSNLAQAPQHLLCVLGMCLLACSSQDPSTDGGTDAGVDDVNAPQEAGSDGGPTGCTDLANTGTVIQQAYVATDPVTGDGGVIADGTYVVTAAVVYTGVDGGSGPTGTTTQATAVLKAGMYELVESDVNDAGADGSPVHANGHFTVSGTSVSLAQLCPKVLKLPYTSYDSDGTKVHLYAPAAGPGNPGFMFEWTKQ